MPQRRINRTTVLPGAPAEQCLSRDAVCREQQRGGCSGRGSVLAEERSLNRFDQRSLGTYSPTSALNTLTDLGLYYVFPSSIYVVIRRSSTLDRGEAF